MPPRREGMGYKKSRPSFFLTPNVPIRTRSRSFFLLSTVLVYSLPERSACIKAVGRFFGAVATSPRWTVPFYLSQIQAQVRLIRHFEFEIRWLVLFVSF